jgi:hypothetical protein
VAIPVRNISIHGKKEQNILSNNEPFKNRKLKPKQTTINTDILTVSPKVFPIKYSPADISKTQETAFNTVCFSLS